ncbi:MAG TPA: hypothetical protein VMU84_14225 [Thermoanaerobaculia bacterium]|nr:hypothetical protein [Thermoanaerobaculia bacterium]
MGSVTIDFIGLHLIHNGGNGQPKTVATINGRRTVTTACFGGITLDVHEPSITVDGRIDEANTDWERLPAIDLPSFELKGTITFSPRVPIVDHTWKPLRVKNRHCENFAMPDGFFERLDEEKHALTRIDAGELTVFKLTRGQSIHTRVFFSDASAFSIARADGKKITLDTSQNATITFLNTELRDNGNDYDWLWYMIATGNRCCGKPDEQEVPAILSDDRDMPFPLNLGCSNSNWP